jgi:hypothetical protein
MQGIEAKSDSIETAWMIPSCAIGLAHLSNSSGLERAMHGDAKEIIKCAATEITKLDRKMKMIQAAPGGGKGVVEW